MANFLRSHDVIPRVSTGSWQNGRAEIHGHIIKQMLDRYDNEERIPSPQDFDIVLQACFQAKNALARHQGYRPGPEQIVLGKDKKLPASLCSDESSVAHSLAIGEGPESENFRQRLNIRARARHAFILADNSQCMRRAMLRRSCPMRGPFFCGSSEVRTYKLTYSLSYNCLTQVITAEVLAKLCFFAMSCN